MTLHILVGKIRTTFFPFSCEACSLCLVLWLCAWISPIFYHAPQWFSPFLYLNYYQYIYIYIYIYDILCGFLAGFWRNTWYFNAGWSSPPKGNFAKARTILNGPLIKYNKSFGISPTCHFHYCFDVNTRNCSCCSKWVGYRHQYCLLQIQLHVACYSKRIRRCQYQLQLLKNF